MGEASRVVLAGFEIRTESKIVRYPDRYADERGQEMWDRVMKIIEELDGWKLVSPAPQV
jgi:hypothetical protein